MGRGIDHLIASRLLQLITLISCATAGDAARDVAPAETLGFMMMDLVMHLVFVILAGLGTILVTLLALY